MNTKQIFKLADLCIEAGMFPGLEDLRYVLLLVWFDGDRVEVHRAAVDCVLPTPCRVWLTKGRLCTLLGDSFCFPADLSDGVRAPFVG